MKFTVAPQVFEKLPGVCFGAVAAYGMNNRAGYPVIAARLDEAIAAAAARFEGKKVKDDPAILPYRTAFQSLGVNPNKFMSSIEAMFTRVAKGKGLPHINPIVDLGNALSLKYVLPMGAHDIVQAEGHDIEVRFSTAADTFIPFGETEAETMPAGELIYTVGPRVRTRHWIWRQSELGKIGPDSCDIFFPIDGFAPFNKDAILAARDELAELCRTVFCCTDVRMGFVDREHPSFDLS